MIMGNEFRPPRRTGFLFQGSLMLAFIFAGGYFFFLATQDPSGLDFLLHMLVALILFAPLPMIGYHLYALMTAVYTLGRDGLLIRWGLRREDIPLRQIEWIRPANELGFQLPKPWLRWPGAILGTRKVAELGTVEFLAADTSHLILVATPEKVYAISPLEVSALMRVYRQVNELGSLAPLAAQSDYPTLLIGAMWEDRVARILILVSLIVGAILFAVTAIAVPNLDRITWTGVGETAPAERLLLLPILDGFLWLLNLVGGIYLYRRGEDLRIAAYLLWGSAGLTGFLLLLASLLTIF